jgi:hypothetical protein
MRAMPNVTICSTRTFVKVEATTTTPAAKVGGRVPLMNLDASEHVVSIMRADGA